MTMSKKTTAILSVLLLASIVSSEMLQSPLRVRINTDLIKRIFNKNDHDALNVFKDLEVPDFELATHKVTDFKVTLVPQSQGNIEDYNLNLSLDENTFIGIEAQDLKFTGSGKIWSGEENSEEFTVSGPLTGLKFVFTIGNQEKGVGKKMDLQEFVFGIDHGKTTVQSTSSILASNENVQELKQKTEEGIKQSIQNIKDEVEKANVNVLQKLPLLSFAPIFGMYIATYGAEKVSVQDSFAEYDFSPISLKLVDKIYDEFTTELETDFITREEGEEQSAVQLIVDQNLINGVIGQFLKIDKMYSLREFLNVDPRFAVFKQLMTTTTLGMALPQYREEFGDGRPCDLVGTVSHEFMTIGLGDDATPSGFRIEKNGNFQLIANVGAQLIIENKQGVWVEGRALYAQVLIKGKLFVADPQHDNRTFVILPKGVQMSQLKILKDDVEQFLEQMLISSFVGFQLDQIKKAFQPVIIPLKKFPNPKEFSCFGFNLTNIAIKVNKGYLQLNANYIDVDTPVDDAFCKEFEEEIKKNPKNILDRFKSIPGLSQIKDRVAGDGMPKRRGPPPPYRHDKDPLEVRHQQQLDLETETEKPVEVEKPAEALKIEL